MLEIGFVMEQTLGHVTHHQNLARWVREEADICPHWLPVNYQQDDLWERVPVVRGNWSLKASLRARNALRARLQTHPMDALFLHTQTVALFALPFMRRIPSVVSLDATPLNYDTVGAEYGHAANNRGWLERRKYQWNRATFHAAAALVTWCEWAKNSLVEDYGVPAEKVTVIPPGVDRELWQSCSGERALEDRLEGPLRLLFVGGDFERKGGKILLEAFRNGLQGACVLDIVTKAEGVEQEAAGMEGVRIYRGLTANSPELRARFAEADLFVFPTLGDCLPIAVMEAMAAGLPIIATEVGALREEVQHGVNGLIVAPRDAGAIVAATRALSADPIRRRAMSAASRQIAAEKFDARRNYGAILALLRSVVNRRP